MREDFLYYIWQHQLFSKNTSSHTGQAIEVLKPGYRNKHDGPDFKEAQVKIDGITWFGAVEIHVKSSDWYTHQHQHDSNYDSVILHVVFKNDKAVFTTTQEPIPTLELKGAIKPKFYERYQILIENPAPIPCATQFEEVPVIKRLTMLEKTLVERLERKSKSVLDELSMVKGDWQEVTFRMISRSMGFKANDHAMLLTARQIPFKWIRKLTKTEEIEALLLGSAGFLAGDFKDEAMKSLQQIFWHFQLKYPELKPIDLSYWKFAPLRPQNQPAQRLVQLAAILYQTRNPWDRFLVRASVNELMHDLQAELSPYWQNHISPERTIKRSIRQVSKTTVFHLLINVTAPMLAAYARQQDAPQYMDKAMNLLTQLSSEENRITKLWRDMNWRCSSAFDSQALNELFQQYCEPKRCLECTIGVHLLNRDS